MQRRSTHLVWLPVLALLLAACGPKAGPRPLVSQLRASAPNAQGVVALWGNVRVDFKDAPAAPKKRQLFDKVNEEVTFNIEVSGPPDRYLPSFVPVRAEVKETGDKSWPDRIVSDIVLFPKKVGGKGFTLHVKDYYMTEDMDPVRFELFSPTDYGPGPRVETFVIKPPKSGDDKATAVVTLDRDAKAGLSVWHHEGDQIYRMKKRGTRIFARKFDPDGTKKHMALLVMGEDWVSPPVLPTPEDDDEDDEDDE